MGHDHAIHHATSGNLDKRGTGDIWTLTVDEYVAAPLRLRLAYRLYRNPFVMFGLGPIYVFLLKIDLTERCKTERTYEYVFDEYIIVAVVAILGNGMAIVPISTWYDILNCRFSRDLAVYVQHTFEDSYFEEDKDWEYVKAAVEGSSFYKLPKSCNS